MKNHTLNTNGIPWFTTLTTYEQLRQVLTPTVTQSFEYSYPEDPDYLYDILTECSPLTWIRSRSPFFLKHVHGVLMNYTVDKEAIYASYLEYMVNQSK